MSKVKVAHVIKGMGLGGVTPIVQQLMALLPRDFYDQTLYCLKRHSDDSAGRAARLQEYQDAGFRVRFPDERETALQTIGRVGRWIDEDQLDILHTHSYHPNLLARTAGLVSRRPGLRLVAHYHNFYDDKWLADGTLPLDRQLARSTDALVACSDAVREHIAERLDVPRDAIDVIRNGVDGRRFSGSHDVAALRTSLGIPEGARVVASVGRISRQKASDDVVRAARIVRDARVDCVFVLAGALDDPFAPAVQQMVSELDLDGHVLFTGHLNDVAPLYALADVVVMPSRWEGFGLVLVETMASGTPLVTTAVGPIPEVVGDGAAVLIPPDSPMDLARAVVSLLENPGCAAALAEKGRARARVFSWTAAGSELEAVYARLGQEVYA